MTRGVRTGSLGCSTSVPPRTAGARQSCEDLLGDTVASVRAVGIGQDLFDYDEGRELARLSTIVAGEGEPGAP